jgi:hypothetical protein
MTSFATTETGRQTGKPIELYQFARHAQVWRYTDSATAVTFGGITFAPCAIARSDYEVTSEYGQRRYTVTLPTITNVVGDAVTVQPPSIYPLTLTVLRYHEGTTFDVALPTSVNYVRIVPSGEVTHWKHAGDTVELTVTPLLTRVAQRTLPRLRIMPRCQWSVYGPGCNLDRASFAVAGTVGTVTATTRTVTVTGTAGTTTAGKFQGGMIMTASGEPGYIESHTTDGTTATLVIMGGVPAGMAATNPVTCYYGCDGQRSTCVTTFNNLQNHMGAPDMPVTDPWRFGVVF